MKKKTVKVKVPRKIAEAALPQNIVLVGERVYDNKNIYIHQKVYSQIHKFAANKTENEHGGVLVGRVVNEMGKENTIIEGFIEAKYNSATPTTLTFTHETWEHFHSELETKYKGKKIVGWIHTHPNFGIFLSENDKFIHENFFTDANQVAYVVDPIQKDEGFFFWVDEKLERCPGFYLFDKNGVNIKDKKWELDMGNRDIQTGSKAISVITIALVVMFVLNIFVILNQTNRIQKLERQVEDLNLVIKYGSMGGQMEVSDMANSIRNTIKMQEEMEKKAQEEQMKKEAEEKKAQQGAPEGETVEITDNENDGGKE